MTDPVDVDALRAEYNEPGKVWHYGHDPRMLTVLDDLVATRRRLVDTTTALEELHFSRNGYCNCCGGRWPCATRRIVYAALAAVAPAPPTVVVGADSVPYPVAAAATNDAIEAIKASLRYRPSLAPFAGEHDDASAVASAPPNPDVVSVEVVTAPPKDFVRCFHDDMGEHGSWVWHHPNYHDKGRPVAPAPPTEPTEMATTPPECAEVGCRPVAPLPAAGPEETTNG